MVDFNTKPRATTAPVAFLSSRPLRYLDFSRPLYRCASFQYKPGVFNVLEKLGQIKRVEVVMICIHLIYNNNSE